VHPHGLDKQGELEVDVQCGAGGGAAVSVLDRGVRGAHFDELQQHRHHAGGRSHGGRGVSGALPAHGRARPLDQVGHLSRGRQRILLLRVQHDLNALHSAQPRFRLSQPLPLVLVHTAPNRLHHVLAVLHGHQSGRPRHRSHVRVQATRTLQRQEEQ